MVDQVVNEFHLTTLPTMPVPDFAAKSNGDPLTVMMEDRGPQITLEVVNGYDLTPDQERTLAVSVPNSHGHLDLRLPILERADQLFEEANLPIVAKLGGVFAIDFVVKGVSKTTAVKHVLDSEAALTSIGLGKADLQDPAHLEIWGDKFSLIRGGTDRHMSEAVDPQVRSIDFRHENPDEFLPGYTTVQWNGERQLHRGLLEYLQSRH